MSFFISLGIVILSVLILLFLQLNPSVFAIFYHNTIGRNSAKKTERLSIYYILGVEVFTFAVFLFVYTLIVFLFVKQSIFDYYVLYWPLAGILFALSIFCLALYYRSGSGTKLFISRSCAKNLINHTKTIKNRSDAFMLGLITSALETFITLPIFIICSLEIMKLDNTFRSISIILLVLSSILPLFAIHYLYRFGANLADIQRFREKNKLPFRLFLFTCLLLLSVLTANVELLS